MKALKKRMSVLASLALTVALALTFVGNARIVSAQSGNITIWTKFNDQNPQNTQDKWLKSALEEFNKGDIKATNVFQPFDKINSLLNVAVQAKGDVPDVSYVDSQQVGFFTQNGTLQDLTDWVKAQSWFSDLDEKALAACTTPDGKILCVPTSTANLFMYYWKDFYPNGVPAATDKFLEAAKEIKANRPDKFAFTGKLAEPVSVERFWYGLILSYGGTVADKDGKATFANPATEEVVKFARTLFAEGYAAKESLAPAFDNEEPFKRGDAGAFVSGSYSYVYLTPLTSPKGTKFEGKITGDFDPKALSVGAAFEAGELDFAPPLAAPNGKPFSLITASAYGIPVGAKNVEGAKAFISFQMTKERNVAFAAAYGALPTLKAALAADEFQGAYWKAVAKLQAEYGVGAPTFAEYDKGIDALATAIVKLITDPGLDIMKELQATQDEYNAGL